MASLFPFLGSKASDSSDIVVAHIGQTEVRASEMRSIYGELDRNDQATLAQDPAKLKEFVQAILVQKIILNEAVAKKWDQQPEIKKKLQAAWNNKMVDTYVEAAAKVPEDYPSEAEIKAAYEAAKPNLMTPRQYLLAQIFIGTPKVGNNAEMILAQAKMEKVREELRKPKADFSALARQFSDDTVSAAKDGELGWVTDSQIDPAIRPKIVSMEKGSISSEIHLIDGWHFVKVVDIRPARTLELGDVRFQLVQQMRSQKARANAQAYLDKVAASSVKIENQNLGAIISK